MPGLIHLIAAIIALALVCINSAAADTFMIAGPSPEPPGTGYEIRMRGVDDTAQVYVNDLLVFETGWGKFLNTGGFNRPGYSGWINIDAHLLDQPNTIRFSLFNYEFPGGWGANFQMRRDGEIFFDYKDSRADSSPGRKINVTLTLNPEAGPSPQLPPVAAEPEIILLSEGDADFDYATTYANLKAQYDFLASYFGRKPTQTIVVHVGPGYGGLSNGYDMWLDSIRIDDTSHNYAHEMMHCYCRDYGHFPNWLFEQLADIAYCESEIYLWGRQTESAYPNDYINGRSGQLADLRIRFGQQLYPKFFTLLHQDLSSGDYAVRTDSIQHINEDLTGYLSRAAGEDVVPHLAERGFTMDQQ